MFDECKNCKVKMINHITLICSDLTRSALLFQSLFNAKEVYSSDGKNFSIANEKFLAIGDLWIALMQGDPVQRSYNHIAFSITEEEFPDFEAKIHALGLEIKPGRQRDPREGKSLYFYDYDNHLFELHTGSLESRLSYYLEDAHL